MRQADSLEAIDRWVVAVAALGALAMAVVSWLGGYRTPRAVAVGPARRVLELPARTRLAGGVCVLALLVAIGRALWVPLPVSARAGTSSARALSGAGLLLSLVGLALAIWARLTLGTMWGSSTSFGVRLNVGHRLVQHGPYAHVRHPLYLGYLLLLLGVALVHRTWAAVAFLAMGFATFYGRARREEVALAEAFGAEWRAYAARTSRLVPYLC